MKFQIVAALFCFSLFSCAPKDNQSDEKTSPKTQSENSKKIRKEAVIGSYVGLFGEDPNENNKITLLVNYIDEEGVSGRTIVGGNDRPFEGSYKLNDDGLLQIEADEPGDNRYDGHFSISLDINQPNQISGKWTPFKNSTSPKSFSLERRKFKYDAGVGDFPQTSQRLLEASEVENLMKEDLSYMRNEIFARHGYCFQKKEWRQVFELNDWYVPNSVTIKDLLTPIEKKNIELIQRYEKYAEEYGDEYGR